MGTAELTNSRTTLVPGPSGKQARIPAHTQSIIGAYAALSAITLVGVMVGTALPALAPGARPHPTLSGSFADFASIATANARVLSAPFLLALFRFPANRRSRQLADLLVGGLLAGNALRVGLALGRWHNQLLPYVPQLPLEWLAAALAGAAWLTLRPGAWGQTTIVYIAGILVLVAAAAAVEAIATPHARTPTHVVVREPEVTALHTAIPTVVRKAGGGLPARRSCAGAGTRFKVASLPSPRCRSVPLGRLTGATGLRQSPPDPAKEGPQ
jgi:hypothetical protein